jgi:hypothetical protein
MPFSILSPNYNINQLANPYLEIPFLDIYNFPHLALTNWQFPNLLYFSVIYHTLIHYLTTAAIAAFFIICSSHITTTIRSCLLVTVHQTRATAPTLLARPVTHPSFIIRSSELTSRVRINQCYLGDGKS